MKMILHHLAKDIRAQRWLLLLWAFVLVIQAGVDLMILLPDYDLSNFADKIRSSPLLGLISGLLWIFLIVQLIQSEPVTGSASFWLTRPVPRRVYIPSKLLFILLFLVVPSLLLTPLNMLEMHTDPAVIAQFIKTDLVWQAAFAIGVLWLATFTRSIGHFLLVVGVLIPLCVIAFALKEMALVRSGSGNGYELTVAQTFLFSVVLFLGLSLSLAFQHIFRKTRSGLWIGGLFTALAVLLGLAWPFALPPSLTLSILPSNRSYSSKTVRVDFTPGWENNVTWRKSTDPNGIPINYGGPEHSDAGPVNISMTARAALTPARAAGKEIDYVEGVTARFHPVDGHDQALPAKDVLDADEPFDVKAAMQADLPDVTINPGEEATTPSVGIFRLDPDLVSALRGKHGILSLELYGHVETFVRKAAIPLEAPAFARLPGEVIHVRRQDSETQTIFGIEIPTAADKPVLSVWSSNFNGLPYFQMGPTVFYLLVDTEKRTGQILRQSTKFRMPTSIGFSARTGWRDFLPLSDGENLDGKVLYIYELRPGNFFNATLSAPDFVMNPP